jgi:hypothetical protein
MNLLIRTDTSSLFLWFNILIIIWLNHALIIEIKYK